MDVRIEGRSPIVRREEIPYGNPKNPMRDAELIAKFRECARYAKKPLPEEKVKHLAEKILELDKAKNIKEISDMFS